MPLAKGWVQPHPEAGATRKTHGPGALGCVTLPLLTSLEKDLLLRSQAGATPLASSRENGHSRSFNPRQESTLVF